jgi:hypothetical protein
MKNFITGVVFMILLLIFPLQNTLEISNDNRMRKFDDIVYNAAQKARQDGYFTQENINSIKSSLIDNFDDLSDGDIFINVTTTPKYRVNEYDEREAISYEISIPIRKIVVAGSILGISDTDNQFRYGKKDFVWSEVLMP